MASQITSKSTVCSTFYTGQHEKLHQRSTLLALCVGESIGDRFHVMTTSCAWRSPSPRHITVTSHLVQAYEQKERLRYCPFVCKGVHRWQVDSPNRGPVKKLNVLLIHVLLLWWVGAGATLFAVVLRGDMRRRGLCHSLNQNIVSSIATLDNMHFSTRTWSVCVSCEKQFGFECTSDWHRSEYFGYADDKQKWH